MATAAEAMSTGTGTTGAGTEAADKAAAIEDCAKNKSFTRNESLHTCVEHEDNKNDDDDERSNR